MDSTNKDPKTGPTKTRRAPRPPKPPSAEKMALIAARAALAKNAADLAILEVTELVNYTDFMVIASGRSTRQVQAIAENVQRAIADSGLRVIGVEGEREGLWILIDWGAVIIHVFHEPVRGFYDLEKLFSEAPRIPTPE